ncbi:MAG: class I SAM-dependent methyltransferase [Gemmataceae bacterium]|nr:class I SAM-dependent methyltransferase [Gemmataceae bacterium]
MSFFPRDLAAPAPAPGLSIEWEEANCPLCSGRRWSPLVEAPDVGVAATGLWFAVVQCQDCGMCFTNPRPSAKSIGQFYPTRYAPHQSTNREHGRARRRLFYKRTGGQQVGWHGEGRLLDFGCGGGGFLKTMHSQGWKVTGLDVSAPTVYRVRAETGLPVLVGTLPHTELQPESFDVITMWHSLEHVHAPREILREAHKLLVPGGKLMVGTPNIDSLPFRWFGRNWYGLDLPRHLTHFTPWTLPLMLERTGFRVGAVRLVRHSQWLRYSARLGRSDRRSPYWHRWLTTGPMARLVTWYSYLTHQADCVVATAYKQ